MAPFRVSFFCLKKSFLIVVFFSESVKYRTIRIFPELLSSGVLNYNMNWIELNWIDEWTHVNASQKEENHNHKSLLRANFVLWKRGGCWDHELILDTTATVCQKALWEFMNFGLKIEGEFTAIAIDKL